MSWSYAPCKSCGAEHVRRDGLDRRGSDDQPPCYSIGPVLGPPVGSIERAVHPAPVLVFDHRDDDLDIDALLDSETLSGADA